MQLRHIFTANCVYAFLFGAGFTFFPGTFSSLVGFDTPGDASLIARVLGLFVIGTGLVTWFARNSSESEARRAIVLSLFILYIALIVYKVLLHTVFGISFNFVFGIIYIIHLGLVIGYGYFLFARPTEGERQERFSR
jgi:predicted Na+-dependent transporter